MTIKFGGIPVPKAPTPRTSQPTVSAPNARTNINDVLEGNYIGDKLEDVGLDPKLAELVRMISPSKWDMLPMGGMLKGVKVAAKPAKTFLEHITSPQLLDDLQSVVGKLGSGLQAKDIKRVSDQLRGQPNAVTQRALGELQVQSPELVERIASSVGADAGLIKGVQSADKWAARTNQGKLLAPTGSFNETDPFSFGHEVYGHLLHGEVEPDKIALQYQRLNDLKNKSNLEMGGRPSADQMARVADAPFKLSEKTVEAAGQHRPNWAYSNLMEDERAANVMGAAFKNFTDARGKRAAGQEFLPDPTFAGDQNPDALKEALAWVKRNTETLRPSNLTAVPPPAKSGSYLDTYQQLELFKPNPAAAGPVKPIEDKLEPFISPRMREMIMNMRARSGR